MHSIVLFEYWIVCCSVERPCLGCIPFFSLCSCHVRSSHLIPPPSVIADLTTSRFESCFDAMSCHAMSCHIMSCLIVSCRHVMSCHAMSCPIMSCLIISCHVMSIVSYHVMSCPAVFQTCTFMFPHDVRSGSLHPHARDSNCTLQAQHRAVFPFTAALLSTVSRTKHAHLSMLDRLAAAAATGAALSAGVEGSAAENERLGVIAARDQVTHSIIIIRLLSRFRFVVELCYVMSAHESRRTGRTSGRTGPQ